MTKEQFEDELRSAGQRYAEDSSLYWCGVCRGLRRAFLGDAASSRIDHFAWLDFVLDPDPCVAELGKGYIDGMEMVLSYRAPGSTYERMVAERRAGQRRRSLVATRKSDETRAHHAPAPKAAA